MSDRLRELTRFRKIALSLLEGITLSEDSFELVKSVFVIFDEGHVIVNRSWLRFCRNMSMGCVFAPLDVGLLFMFESLNSVRPLRIR